MKCTYFHIDFYLPGYVGIESLEGSFYNVMGLPVQRLCRELECFIEALPSCYE